MRLRMHAICMFLAACATTGDSGQGDLNLPTAGVGPFRKLDGNEVPGVAPFVLDDRTMHFREPCAFDEGGDTILFAVATVNGKDVIVRSRATDGRAFYGTGSDTGHTPPVVLAADQNWEGDSLADPFALRGPKGDVLLFYAGEGGIGIASGDGHTFKKLGQILPAGSGPTAYLDDIGQIHVFYSMGSSIAEAISGDGIGFARVPGTVLDPSPPAPPGSLLPNEKGPFDTVRVSDPTVSTRITPAGRFHVRVIYAAEGDGGARAIGFAARYGHSGPLTRNPVPVFSVNQEETAPAYLDRGDSGSFLYVQQTRRIDATTSYPAIAAAFAPGNVHLGTPAPFPDSP